jgi:hypothetical protein
MAPLLLLAVAAGSSVQVLGGIPQGELHPLALMLAMLPLQLAALVWVWARSSRLP